MPKAKRALLIGLDALAPKPLQKFLDEGVLPNLARMADHGCLTRILPAIPPQTPTNWTCLATGASPGRHGVVQWGSHIPGEPLHEFHSAEAFNAGLCRAEYLWEAAARCGKRSVVMNYAGYPPTCDAAVHIDWLFQPARSYYDLAPATTHHNCPEPDTSDPIELGPAEGWRNAPRSAQPPLEAEIAVAPAVAGTGPTCFALVTGGAEGYDTVAICPERDASAADAVLKTGQWSDWIRGDFIVEETDEKVEGAFRLNLVELSPDGRRLSFFREAAFPTDGRFCSDPALGRRLVETLGPYVHSAASCDVHRKGWLADFAVVDKVMADEAEWWSGAARLVMDETDASLLVLHWHNLDAMGHTFIPKIEPTAYMYEPDRVEENWETIRGYYRAADRFVGAFLDKFDDGETVFAVVADHGMPGNIKAVSLVNVFKQRGWLALTDDGLGVDWPRSKLFFSQNHLWINLQGRDQGGVVPPERYASLRAEILAAMRDVKNPDTGEHALAFALTREDAPMVGLWGDHVGDIVFCYNGGYRWSGPEVLRLGEERVVFPGGGGNHGPMPPTYETDTTSVMGSLALLGAGIRAGVKLPKWEQFAVRTVDLAPTLAALLGIDAPAQNEGRVLQEFLADACTEGPERTLIATARPIVRRPAKKPTPITLQGDVTDEP